MLALLYVTTGVPDMPFDFDIFYEKTTTYEPPTQEELREVITKSEPNKLTGIRSNLADLAIADLISSRRTEEAVKEQMLIQLANRMPDMTHDQLLQSIDKVSRNTSSEKWSRVLDIINS